MHNIKKIIEKNIENVFMNYILALHFNVYNIYIFKNADDDSRISDWFENYLCFFFALNLHPMKYIYVYDYYLHIKIICRSKNGIGRVWIPPTARVTTTY